MTSIPEIVKEYVLKHCKRMPETEEEVNEYLDLINHCKRYEASVLLSSKLSKKWMKKLGVKTPKEIIEEGKTLFNG